MAQARKVQRKQSVASVRDEFPVKLKRVLSELLDPGEVEPGDKWTFVDAGTEGLIIVRTRDTTTTFDDDGKKIEPEA